MTVRVRNLTALGLTSGIGSLLVGARQAGFEVLGNVEWRRYYFSKDPLGRNTFTENFPGAIFKNKIEDLTPQEIERVMNADLALSHPECGRYSQLSSMNTDQSDDPGDIPLFVDLVARLKPKFFIMDDLPKCFKAFPMREFSVRLPEYDLYPEWISNFHYGNVQKNRKRMFMVGAMKSERWAFRPGERENALTLRDVIGDLGEPRAGSNYPNHDPHVLDEIVGRGKHLETLGRDRAATYADLRDFFQSNPSGTILRYVSSTGKIKVKPSHATGYWNAHAHVLDGASLSMHPIRCLPYTIRERARIQGFPDDFVFYGTRLNAAGEWNHEKNNNIIKQTGKAMPIQCERAGRGTPPRLTVRVVRPPPHTAEPLGRRREALVLRQRRLLRPGSGLRRVLALLYLLDTVEQIRYRRRGQVHSIRSAGLGRCSHGRGPHIRGSDGAQFWQALGRRR